MSSQFKDAVQKLYDAGQAAITPFFARYPELLARFYDYVGSADPPEKKWSTLLANLLHDLKLRRKHQQAIAAVCAASGIDQTFAQAVLDDAAVLHAAADVKLSAVDDLTALEGPGLLAQFYGRDSATVPVDRTIDPVPSLDYSAKGPTKLPADLRPGAPISGLWTGYLEVPENDFYNLAVETDPDAAVSLELGGKAVALVHNGNVWSNQGPIALTAGTLYLVGLKVEKVKDRLAVRWETHTRSWQIIPSQYLYSASLTDRLRRVYIRFLKAASLATGLKLTANETAHFAKHQDYQVNSQGWLNVLAVSSGDPDIAPVQATKILLALLDFARIKSALAPDDERLLAVLQDPNAILPDKSLLLLALTRWESGSLNALFTRYGKAMPDLGHLETFRRVYDTYAMVKTLGIPASTLISATTNDPDPAKVRDFRSALRARYDRADWLGVIKPINDELRRLQRDALVAYILQKFREQREQGQPTKTSQIDTADKLFEYFLMDVLMEPSMQTSRIRHALSSVQLFIERCLMNLEPPLSLTPEKAAQWEWMKRYRVWEANRKVFLWPENWLEPELRDDQSPFFKEAMSELLQSDITEDTAATALLNYLSKLDEVAKLEPCGIYYVESGPGKENDVAHVVARTAGANRKYYYRRRESTSWSPWEQIKLDIEDNPVIPVVWNGRIFLFWLRILQQPPIKRPFANSPSLKTTPSLEESVNAFKAEAQTAGNNLRVEVKAVLCWSEFYNGKWQQTRTSDPSRPVSILEFDPDPYRYNHFDRSQLRLRAIQDGDALGVKICYGNNVTYPGFRLYNAHSVPVDWSFGDSEPTEQLSTPVGPSLRSRWMPRSGETLTILYQSRFLWMWLPVAPLSAAVLNDKISFTTIEPCHPLLLDVWRAPFFFADSNYVFYVTTTWKEAVLLLRYLGDGIAQESRRRAPRSRRWCCPRSPASGSSRRGRTSSSTGQASDPQMQSRSRDSLPRTPISMWASA